MPNREKAKHISNCLELAMLLEVIVPKPGNVTPTASFEGTRIEHFLASAVAVESSFEKAARRGTAISENKLSISQVGIGGIIKDCAEDINAWQKGGNTLLGTVMLFVPLAVAAGMTPAGKKFVFDFYRLRENLRLAVESTTAEDAVNLYEAIDVAKPSGLGGAPDLDVTNPLSKTRLLEDDVSLFDVFKIAEDYDEICSEWVRNYPTFIARKAGVEKAREVSSDAKITLELGGLETTEGRETILKLDGKLRAFGNQLNPGTTADLTAAALALCTLSGYRP
jgi:triphosphoribosyl-dephospho-CoA synthase